MGSQALMVSPTALLHPLTLKPRGCFTPRPLVTLLPHHRYASTRSRQPRPPRCELTSSVPDLVSSVPSLAFSDLAPVAAAAYGTLLLGGGLFAYVRSSSKGSLFGGLSGAATLGLAYVLMSSSDTKDIGEALGFGAGFLFASVFGIRFFNSRKAIPSLPLLVLSLGAAGLFIGAYMQDHA